VGRTLRIIALSIGVTTFTLFWVFGLAIWVFIPLLPAALIFGIAIYEEWQRTHKNKAA
jgi:hypothetical protein